MAKLLLSGAELRAVVPLAGATALRMFGLFLLLPVIAPYVAGLPGGSVALAGLAVGIYGLTQAMMLAPLGWVSDRVGRKPVLVAGMLVFALGGYLAGAVEHPAVVVLGRALQGCGAISAVVLAAISDCTAERTRAQAMAMTGVGIGLAFGLAVVCAGPLAAWLGVAGLLQATAWLGVLGAAAALAAPLPKRRARRAAPGALVDLRMLPLCAGVFVIHLALAALFVRVPLLLAPLIDTGRLWQVYLGAFALGAIAAAPLIVLRGASRAALAAGGALVAAAAAGVAAFGQHGALLLTALLAVFFAGFNYLEASLPARASVLALPGARGAALGVYAISQALGVFAGGWLAGELGQEYNQASLVIVSVLAAVWSGAYFYFTRANRA